jgi:hypothetical protein
METPTFILVGQVKERKTRSDFLIQGYHALYQVNNTATDTFASLAVWETYEPGSKYDNRR